MKAAGVSTHQFLTALADVLQRGEVRDPASFKTVAEGIAAEMGGAAAAAKALMQSVPDGWNKDPAGHETRAQAQAFLEVAAPVLKVDVGAAAKLAQAYLARGKDADIAIEINRAAAAAKDVGQTLGQVIDLSTITHGELHQLLTAAFEDPVMAKLLGLRDGRGAFSKAPGELASALYYSRPAPPNEATIYAGGKAVGGPEVRAQYADMIYGSFFSLPREVQVGNVALCVARLAMMRDRLGEIREEISGAAVRCGHGVPKDAIPLYVVPREDGGLELGLALDHAKLRAYQASSFDDETITKRVGGLLRERFDEMMQLVDRGVPTAIAVDRERVAQSPMLGELAKQAAKSAS